MSESKPLRRVVIMAGGTGGHVFPALAVARELVAQGVAVSWLGTARGIESTLVSGAGFNLHCLNIEGVRGKGVTTLLKAPFLLLGAVAQAVTILRRENPDVVLGLGGFASGPGGLAARLLGKPLVIHEQNAVAGTTNRWLAKIATRVLQAFPGSLPRGETVGNPVRVEIAAVAAPAQRLSAPDQPLRLLVLGGSLGALALNQLVPGAVAELVASGRLQVHHQTGKAHCELTRALYTSAGIGAGAVTVEPFVTDMAAAYAWADVVICRAGALTVAELTAAGCAALLVPYPHAIDDHQTRNAEWLVRNQAAELKAQHELTPAFIKAFIEQAISDRSRLLVMATHARRLAMPAAAQQVAAACQEVVHG